MSSSLQEVGEMFRNRRKELNFSLKEVENSTSIRVVTLQSIEEGKLNDLISPVYAQGFVRQYAIFLGIDGDKVVQDYPEIFNRKVVEGKDFHYGIGTLESRGHSVGGVKAVPNAVWYITFLGIFFVAWGLAKFLELI